MVSIHAPARGATMKQVRTHIGTRVSIHAPARGATFLLFKKGGVNVGFNPRSRTGSDLFTITMIFLSLGFNPRSRTGSDDTCAEAIAHGIRVSIHAPARGATGNSHFYSPSMIQFQSTLPHGERQRQVRFQPCGGHVSIHAPARGATSTKTFVSPTKLFQSTLPHGERPSADNTPADEEQFQSTLPHGERHRTCTDKKTIAPFQSTLPHGERLTTIRKRIL